MSRFDQEVRITRKADGHLLGCSSEGGLQGGMWLGSWGDRREESRAGRARLCWALRVPFCRTSHITTVSYLGNKDMIRSGAHFLSALKSVAGKMWSTVIMEDDKDGKAPGRAPAPRSTAAPRGWLCSLCHLSPVSLDAWAMATLPSRKESKWGEQPRSAPYQRQCWGTAAVWRRKWILFPWQLKFEKSI